MRRDRIRRYHGRSWPGLVFTFLFLATLAGVVYGGEQERRLPDTYPDTFFKTGRIDRIAEDEIVIGDTLFMLSPEVTYHIRFSGEVSKARFHVGDTVGVVINPHREVLSLWLLE
jgi:hypothetical protein